MADDKKKAYPKIAQSSWFALRDKFKQRVPADVSASYVATALGMAEDSANSNVIAPLKALGLVHEDGKPSELAYDWRDDDKYKEVCEKIIQSVYPQELHDLFHDKNVSLDKLTPWFMRNAKVGEPAAKMFARTYQLLIERDPAKAQENNGQKAISKAFSEAKPRKQKSAPSSSKADAKSSRAQREDTTTNTNVERDSRSFNPQLHIDIQIHIAPESSSDLIDKIFESMAKHLKGIKP